MTATSYELNQAAESAVKSGILTPKERELVKKKFEEEPAGDQKWLETYRAKRGEKINKEEVVKKIKSTGYKGKTFFVRTANSFKFEDQVRGFLTPIFKEKYPDLEEDVLHDKIGRLFESGYLDKFKESKQITEGDLSDIIKEYEDYDKIDETSYELNQAAESAVKSGMQNLKPVAKVIGEDGNVFNLIGICMKALKRAGQPEKAKEMQEKIFAAGSYEEALNIMGEYCDLQ
jgi:hypothetical protein